MKSNVWFDQFMVRFFSLPLLLNGYTYMKFLYNKYAHRDTSIHMKALRSVFYNTESKDLLIDENLYMTALKELSILWKAKT